MPDSQNHHTGGEPTSIAPKGIGLGVQLEVHPKIDMGNDRIAEVVSALFNRGYFFQSLRKGLENLLWIGWVARTCAARLKLCGSGGQAFGSRASTAAQSTKFINSSM